MSEKYFTILELCPEENFEEFEPVVMDDNGTFVYCEAMVPASMIKEDSYYSYYEEDDNEIVDKNGNDNTNKNINEYSYCYNYYEDDSIETNEKNDNDNDTIDKNMSEDVDEKKVKCCCYISIKKMPTRKLLSLTEMILIDEFDLEEMYKNRVLNRLYREAECRERKRVDIKENRLIMYKIDMDFMNKKKQDLVSANEEEMEVEEKIEKIESIEEVEKIEDLEEIKETEELEKAIEMIDDKSLDNNKQTKLKIGTLNSIEVNKNSNENKNSQINYNDKKQQNYRTIELNTEENSCISKGGEHINCCSIC